MWTASGFAMVILSAALKAIPVELFEAARVDGASELRIITRLVLPLRRPTVIVVGTLLLISALKAFDIVYVMTNGAFDTDVIANRMYRELLSVDHLGRAAAIAVLLLLATLPVILLNLRQMRLQTAER